MQKEFSPLKLALLAFVTFSSLGFSERYRGSLAHRDSSVARSTQLRYKSRSPKPQSSIFGGVEIRPSMETKEGAFFTENAAWLGAKFPTWSLWYVQDFETQPTSNLEEAGNPLLGDGHVRGMFDNLWQNSQTSFGYEARVYFPLNAVKRDRGYTTSIRNYFKINHKLNSTVTLWAMEVPILHFYSQDGFVGADGKASANPAFENRVILGSNFALSEHVTFSVPIHIYSTKYKYFGETANLSDEWDPNVFFWPEIYWSVGGGPVTLGAGYRSNNLMKVTEDGTSSDTNGTFQAIFGMSF